MGGQHRVTRYLVHRCAGSPDQVVIWDTVEITVDNPVTDKKTRPRLLKPGMYGAAEIVVAVKEKLQADDVLFGIRKKLIDLVDIKGMSVREACAQMRSGWENRCTWRSLS